MNFRNILYALTCLSFTSILGGAVYEHVAVWPPAFSEVPRSLSMFQGTYKLNSPMFWMPIHPVTFSLLIVTLILCWKTARRKNVLITITGYALILLSTFIFFVPELLDLVNAPYSDTIDPTLQSRADRWVILSLLRGALVIVLAMTLVLGLTKSEKVSDAK